MNQRIKKKRWLEIKIAYLLAQFGLLHSAYINQNNRITELEKLHHAQGEQIEALEGQISDLKRLVKQNTVATNNELESLEGKIKKVAADLQIKTTKKGFWKK